MQKLLKKVVITKTMDFTQECNFLLHFPCQKTFPQVQPFAQGKSNLPMWMSNFKRAFSKLCLLFPKRGSVKLKKQTVNYQLVQC